MYLYIVYHISYWHLLFVLCGVVRVCTDSSLVCANWKWKQAHVICHIWRHVRELALSIRICTLLYIYMHAVTKKRTIILWKKWSEMITNFKINAFAVTRIVLIGCSYLNNACHSTISEWVIFLINVSKNKGTVLPRVVFFYGRGI